MKHAMEFHLFRNSLMPLLGAAFILASRTASAADIAVTTLADAGAGSLRQAVAAANATPGEDRILIQVPGTIVLGSGAVVVEDAVQIVGCAGCAVTAQGGSRVFEINGDPNEPRAMNVIVRNLTLSAGTSSGDGGILRAEYVTLRIENSQLLDTTASAAGGAAYLDACDATVTGSRFANNRADGFGGAIASNASSLRIERSTFIANRAEAGGGAIWGNWANDAALVVHESTFDRNSAAFDGGAIEAHLPVLRISGSTFVDNAADYWAGGALYVGEDGTAPMEIDNSTFVGNRATHEGGQGSAILLSAGRLRMRHVTVAGNIVGVDKGGEQGAAIEVSESEAHLELVNSILADNVRDDGAPADLARRHDPATPNVVTARHNLIGALPVAGTINGVSVGNLMGVASGLDSFGSHGGPTTTYSLQRGSPACDAGEPQAGLATDQRGAGFVRAWGGPDIGAFEFRGDTLFRNGFELDEPPAGCSV